VSNQISHYRTALTLFDNAFQERVNAYDNTNRLASITTPSGTDTYQYNALGQRVEKTVGSTTTVFVYDEAGHLIGAYTPSGGLIAENIWLHNRPVGVITSAGLYYVHTDQLGTPRVITNSSKTIVWQWHSNPFGNGAPTGSLTYNLRLPGQYYDAETGHDYNYLRDYDPTTGRYIESDPIGLAGGSPSTYAYAGGNPFSNFDPLGLFCTSSGGYTLCAYPGGPAFMLPIANIDFYGLCWIYSQSTGRLTHVDDKGNINYTADATADSGYSGYGPGLNNPAMQSVQAKKHGDPAGPIPQGLYIIGKPYDSPTTGPISRVRHHFLKSFTL